MRAAQSGRQEHPQKVTVSKILDTKEHLDDQYIPAHEALKLLRAHSALQEEVFDSESGKSYKIAKTVTLEAPYKPIFNRNHFKRFKKIIKDR